MKHFFFLFTALIATTALWAEDFTVDGIAYNKLGGDSVEVWSRSPKYSGDIIIPATVTYKSVTYRVTSIKKMAFYYCTSLTSVIIGNNVTSIEEMAFYYCTSLDSVSIPNSVTSIGNSAFYGCTSLTSVIIDNSVTSIGDWVFTQCTSLPIENNIRYADWYLVEAISKKDTTYNIKPGTKWIGSGAFSTCSKLKSITIPNSIIGIGDEAFSGCSKLTTISIPSSVNSIDDNAFNGCNSLPVENGLRYADTYLLRAVDQNDTTYTIKPGTKWIAGGAFSNCYSLKSITIPNSVISIGDYAFGYCTFLQSITIPNSVTNIGRSAFSSCRSLHSITIGNRVTSIGEYAFDYCDSIKSITCYITTPPTCGVNCFLYVNKSIPLYVPANSISAYHVADQWEDFTNIQAISAIVTDPVTTVITTPDETTATITWPTTTGANSYTIEIKKDDVVFCTLTFNAQGQLTNIAFAPGRGMSNDIAMAETVNGGYKFTITSLNPGTTYTYVVDTKNAGGTSITNYTGSFTTTAPTALEEASFPSGEDRGEACKIFRNGHLLILRDGKTYNAQGTEVR